MTKRPSMQSRCYMIQGHTVYSSDSACLLLGGLKRENPPTEEEHLSANLGLTDAKIYMFSSFNLRYLDVVIL